MKELKYISYQGLQKARDTAIPVIRATGAVHIGTPLGEYEELIYLAILGFRFHDFKNLFTIFFHEWCAKRNIKYGEIFDIDGKIIDPKKEFKARKSLSTMDFAFYTRAKEMIAL